METAIENGFYVIRHQNNLNDETFVKRSLTQEYIQFHFCLKGRAIFSYNANSYQFTVNESQTILLYNPQKELPIDACLIPGTWMLSLILSIKKFHSLFSSDADHIHFLSPDNISKKFYDNKPLSPAMAVVLSQMLQSKLHDSIKALYFKGKVYELLSLYFNKEGDENVESCPFLEDEAQAGKIHLAKKIILERMTTPPSLNDLASEIGLNTRKLKEGFKQLYGQTVFSYLLDHKMEEARRMLESQQYNVNEVGLRLGYSTSSHFIAAFKKKFGTTPKKYLMSVSS